jgi:hypothetical protein
LGSATGGGPPPLAFEAAVALGSCWIELARAALRARLWPRADVLRRVQATELEALSAADRAALLAGLCAAAAGESDAVVAEVDCRVARLEGAAWSLEKAREYGRMQVRAALRVMCVSDIMFMRQRSRG